MKGLEKKLKTPRSRNLVFTSAGDRSNLHCWLKGRRNFDLWVTYYGAHPNRYRDLSDYYLARQDGKFPNLHYAYRHFKSVLEGYDAVLVMDDDVILGGGGVSRLFEIREKYDLWLLQPAFDPRGKISYPVTGARPLAFLRYTNFVENTCPLFRRDVLDEFMKVFDPVLVGWGTDWWFMNHLQEASEKKKVAVVDAITCLNPTDEMKGGQREIDLLQDTPTRVRNWKTVQLRHNLREFLNADQREYGREKFPPNAAYLASALKYWAQIKAHSAAAKLRARASRLRLRFNER